KPRGFASSTSMSLRIARSARLAPLAQTVEDQKRGTDGNRTVSRVERWIGPLRIMKQKKVDDPAKREPIPQVAERTAHDERQAEAVHRAAATPQEPSDDKRR